MMQPLRRRSFGPPVLLALLIGLAALLLAAPDGHAKKSLLDPVRWAQLSTLHPTQAAIGLREVETKRREIEDKSPQRLERYLVKHPIPRSSGPGRSFSSSTTIISAWRCGWPKFRQRSST